MNRRSFLVKAALACAIMPVSGLSAMAAPFGKPSQGPQDVCAAHIPHWRGFNLQGRFPYPNHPYNGPAYDEFDFATTKEWGFNFARLPLAYWAGGSRDDWSLIRGEPFKEIDRAVELGKQYGIHTNINFHRIPGYCINQRELGVGIVPQNSARSDACLDGRLPVAMERRRLGERDVEPAPAIRRPRQRTRRRAIRGLQRSQARSQDAGFARQIPIIDPEAAI